LPSVKKQTLGKEIIYFFGKEKEEKNKKNLLSAQIYNTRQKRRKK